MRSQFFNPCRQRIAIELQRCHAVLSDLMAVGCEAKLPSNFAPMRPFKVRIPLALDCALFDDPIGVFREVNQRVGIGFVNTACFREAYEAIPFAAAFDQHHAQQFGDLQHRQQPDTTGLQRFFQQTVDLPRDLINAGDFVRPPDTDRNGNVPLSIGTSRLGSRGRSRHHRLPIGAVDAKTCP
jgi:hypothetical protein